MLTRLKLLLGKKVPGGTFLPPGGGPGEPPSHLTAAQREVWLELVVRLPPGMLQACDVLAFESLCVNVVIERALRAMIEKKGPLQKDRVHGGQARQAAWLKAHRS